MTCKKLRTKGNRWCEVTVELHDGRLSICGSEGRIVGQKAAKAEAFRYWESFFEEEPTELGRMAIEHGTRTPRSAARLVQRIDGDLHGLDFHGHTTNGRLMITESCGQISETIVRWFPEVAPYLKYHLNDMHAECEHQEARGETYGAHPNAVCPDCGYKLGSAWLKRELPVEVIAWAEAFGGQGQTKAIL